MPHFQSHDGRVRLVYVSFVYWLDSLMNDRRVKCINAPRNARVVAAFPCTERWNRDVVIWLHSPDFDPVAEGGVIPEYNLQWELHMDDPVVTAMADALRPLAARVHADGVDAPYPEDVFAPLFDSCKSALDKYTAAFGTKP